MKRIFALLLIITILSGCTRDLKSIEPGLKLRERLLSSNGCSFEAKITADYIDELYTFTMQCTFDNAGNMTFTVIEPESISGISGKISSESSQITFDDQALAFPLLADDQITPISSPWLLVHTLRGGYIRACAENNNEIHLIIDDSYEENALQTDVYLGSGNNLLRGEFLFRGRRIIAIDVVNFKYL